MIQVLKNFKRPLKLLKIGKKRFSAVLHLTYIMAILKALIIKPKSLSAMHLDFVALIVLDYVYYFIISIKNEIGKWGKEEKITSNAEVTLKFLRGAEARRRPRRG